MKRLSRVFRVGLWILAALFVLLIVWINLALYRGPHSPVELEEDVLAQLHNIRNRLHSGEGTQMQSLFPEGWFFSHVLYGFAWVNVGLTTTNESLRQEAMKEARWVIDRSGSPEGKAPFLANTQVPNGVFYLGWRNRMLGGLLKLQRGEERHEADVRQFREQSEILARAYAANGYSNLAAYPDQTWPCDNVVALASLRLHDTLFGTDHRTVIERWISCTRTNLDPYTSLIPHKVNASNGAIEIAARASTQSYILAFLPELNASFSADQHRRFRSAFVRDWLGLMPVTEYPKGKSGRGDIDTGPLIFGISPSATVVSIALARANGDQQLFERNVALSEIIGLPYRTKTETSFAFGQIVVADAFLAWGKSLVPWSGDKMAGSFATGEWWQWKIHLVSLVTICAGAIALRWATRKRLR